MTSYDQLLKAVIFSYFDNSSVHIPRVLIWVLGSFHVWSKWNIMWTYILELALDNQTEVLERTYCTWIEFVMFFSFWICLDIWDYMGFKWSLNKKHDLSSPPTIFPWFQRKNSFLYPWKNFSVKWTRVTFLLRNTFSEIQIQMDSDGLSESIWKFRFRWLFDSENIFWIYL